MSNLEIYDEIFCEILNADPAELNESFTFADVAKWDSVAHLSLIGELEDAFDVFFEVDDILHYGSYENGKEILRRYGVDI